MIRQTDEAYVLLTHELGESDLIVALLARDHGKLRGVARAARASRRRFGGVLEPLTRVRVSWSERAGSDLHRLEEVEALRSFAEMQRDPALQAACAVVCELSDAFSREGQAEQTAFRLVGAVLEALESGREPWSVVRYFEYWMLRVHGLLPDWESCAACGKARRGGRGLRVDARGEVRCPACAEGSAETGRTIGGEAASFLNEAARVGPEGLSAGRGAALAGGALEWLLRGTLESFAERRFRTYRHLRAATARPSTEDAAR